MQIEIALCLEEGQFVSNEMNIQKLGGTAHPK